ncbi:MAG: HlyC/CorC family transporter [Candidatus Aminicenantes bacterium]|nr:HlyC/CorC family transporter [Candidatus Aminicenantes bacterium]
MEIEFIEWLGCGLSFLAAFIFSLFHMSLWSTSKIAISRFLEDKEKTDRLKIHEIFDDLRISVEIMRALFLIAFLIYLFIVFPALALYPLWFLLLAFAVHLIFFNLLPRIINTLNSKGILTFFLRSYKIPYYLCKPLLIILNAKVFQREIEEERETSEEEIQAFVEEAEEEGIIEKEEGLLLKSIVEFGDTIVREIMTPRVSMVCMRRSATIETLRELVVKEMHSRIPVFQDRIDNIEGVVIAKDLLEYAGDDQKSNPIEPLIRPVYFVPESMKVAELLKEFQKRKQKMAVVVDEHGGVSGIVTMEDLMEEIVGEIQDEYDKDEIQFIKQTASDYIVLGVAEIEDLEEIFDIDLECDEYNTVGGFITHYLGRLPEKGEHLELKGLEVEILEVDQKRIRKLRIKKKGATEPSQK